jgi:hypothetical protein
MLYYKQMNLLKVYVLGSEYDYSLVVEYNGSS